MTEQAIQPIETCPKKPGVPYVLLRKNMGPLIAEWSEDDYVTPCWNLWLKGEAYHLPLRTDEIVGWYPIQLSQEDVEVES